MRDFIGVTPIHLAARQGNLQITKLLIKAVEEVGDDPITFDHMQRTPIHYAARHGHGHVLLELLESTEEPITPDNRGKTPIHWAAERGQSDVIKYLVDRTDNPVATDLFDRTPIHYAARCGDVESGNTTYFFFFSLHLGLQYRYRIPKTSIEFNTEYRY